MGYQSIDLAALRAQSDLQPPLVAFRHQIDALWNLSSVFDWHDSRGKGGLLALPTGVGKTFTAVKWLCDYALFRNVRVLGLAHAFHLLDQANETFCRHAARIPPPRRTLNLRLVSSNPAHDKVASIQTTDDVVIITTQTAISAWNNSPLDDRGRPVATKLRARVECRPSADPSTGTWRWI